MKLLKSAAMLALALSAYTAQAQTLNATGALVVVPANGEVTAPNDLANATFVIEETDANKAAAADRVNQKMKQAVELLKREDPQAVLKTVGYNSYPLYSDSSNKTAQRVPTSWRVSTRVQLATTNLTKLPSTVAHAQKIMALNGIYFSLSPAAARKLDDQRIAAAYRNLSERVASIASAMGRPASDAIVDTIDFEGSGNYAQRVEVTGSSLRAMGAPAPAEVAEPSFEPGETTLNMRVVGKVRFK